MTRLPAWLDRLLPICLLLFLCHQLLPFPVLKLHFQSILLTSVQSSEYTLKPLESWRHPDQFHTCTRDQLNFNFSCKGQYSTRHHFPFPVSSFQVLFHACSQSRVPHLQSSQLLIFLPFAHNSVYLGIFVFGLDCLRIHSCRLIK